MSSLTQQIVTEVQSCVFRGVPVDRYSRKETIIAYWGFGLYWGKAVSQNKKGHLIGHIKVGNAPVQVQRKS